MVRFRILGPLEAETAEGPLILSGRRQRAVLALLLTSEGPVSAERAVVEVWGEDAPPETVKTLRSVVSRLRSQLGDSDLIRTVPAGYVLDVDPQQIDVARFRSLVEESRAAAADGDLHRAAATLREAMALWGGEPLADLQDLSFARLEASHLSEMRAAARVELAEHDLALGRHREVVVELTTLVEEDPYREEPWRLLITALYRSDRQADALRAFDRCREALAEIGLEPTQDLRALAGAVAAQDAALDAPETPDAPPSGMVTLVFTDLADTTRLWEEDPERMRTAVGELDTLIARALRSNGGHVFATRGDSHTAAFVHPDRALSAAVDILRQASGSTALPGLAPRVAIHTGEMPAGSGHHRGPVVERTLRLLESAHGGQIVLSAPTRELIGQSPEGVRVKDLGEHRLFDLSPPERIFQLSVDGLPDRFPPLETLGGRPNNLPVQLTTFVGRSAEVAQVARLLDTHRLVTLVGTGGAGKSRLALQTAVRLLERSPAGAWLVELATVDRPRQVIPEIAETFAVRDMETESGRSLLDVLVDHVAGREMLMVLDNCEHVLDAAADATQALLERCPGLSILATSREPLGVPGETLFAIPPLGLPDADDVGAERSEAVRLFAERAAESRPGFAITASNRPAVAELVRRLDGLPLAIELAASRANVLGPAEILERLSDRFALLAGPGGRHETLVAALDWSHDLLQEPERVLFRRLAVFSGGWTLSDAEAVCASPPIDEQSVLDLMGGLVDKSLVEPTERAGRTRYRLLETIREYASERLRTEEPGSQVFTRHAEHYLALAEEADAGLKTKEQGAWVRRLEAEHDNLRAAIDWATATGHGELALRLVGALGWFWWVRGYWKEAMARFRTAYEATPDADPALRAWTVCRVTRIEAFRIRPREVAPLIAEARTALVAADDPGRLAWATLLHSETDPLLGDTVDWDRSISLMEDSIRLFEAAEDAWGAALARYTLGLTMGTRGDDTTTVVRGAIGEMERLGDRWTAAWFSFNLGTMLAARGDLGTARSAVARSLELAPGTGDVWVGPHALSRRAAIDVMAGQIADAIATFDEVLPLLQQIGDENCTAMSWLYRGEAAGAAGDACAGLVDLRAALGTYQDIGNPIGIARALLRAARLVATLGDLERAARLLGATGAARERTGEAAFKVFDRAILEQVETAVGADLEPQHLERLRAEGATLDDDAVTALLHC